MVTAGVTLTALGALSVQAQVLPGQGGLGQRPGLGGNVLGQRPGVGLPGQRPAPKNYVKELTEIANKLAAQLGTRVVVDPALMVAQPPKEPAGISTPEQLLDSLKSQAAGAAWKKVYLNVLAANSLPAPAALAETVRALDMVEQAGVVLEDPATKRATSYQKNFQVPNNFEQVLESQQFSSRGVYVLYATKSALPSGANLEEQFADLGRMQMEMMQQMTPEQMSNAMMQQMTMFQNMDPQTRQRFMGNMMQAGMRMFQNMSPEQRNNMMSIFGGIPGRPGGPGRPRP
jgi:hypothetical protein